MAGGGRRGGGRGGSPHGVGPRLWRVVAAIAFAASLRFESIRCIRHSAWLETKFVATA